jgi:acyl-CoA reductase-like NAD-dependent aldehyde dehydrogenase
MPANTSTTTKRWTAAELRRLPAHERDAILKQAAALAEKDYGEDAGLTAFEAFGKDDLHGDSSSAEPR